MQRELFDRLARQYRDTLQSDIIPFWETHSPDREQGGYFTCLDRQGKVYDTDKFVWLQGRQVWMFAKFFNELEQRESWLDMAKLGADFLKRHGQDADGKWFFSLTREGRPLIQPCNIYSDCFAAMAFSEYAKASGDEQARELALSTYRQILTRRENPKGKYAKQVPGTRPMMAMGMPMILLNITQELRWMLDGSEADTICRQSLSSLFKDFLDPASGIFHENVAPDGTKLDCFEGRVINPGHGIENMWFVMEVAEQQKNQPLIEQACDVVIKTLEFAWDKEHGGIFYFLDKHGHPPQQLEWDQKLWWVHVETLISLLMGYRLTRRPELWQWFERVQDYTWTHFPDPEYGEWYGYLNRQGNVLLPLKGGKWKGCFHIPRGLYRCMLELEKLTATTPA
jgi:N-acylglucosamine 2-epimerase